MSSPDQAQGKLIVCAGMAVIDHVYRVDRFPAPGAKTRANAFSSVLGGCAANAAVAIHRLGGRARIVAPLGGPRGSDLTGDAVVARLDRERIDAAHILRVDGANSSLSTIVIDGSGERLILSHRDPALEAARPPHPERTIADADAVLIDNRFPDFVLPVARAAMSKGKVVVLDADKPTQPTDGLLTAATHIVFSADGLRATAQTGDLAAALVRIGHHTNAFVAVTDGPRAMLWLDQGTCRQSPAFAVEVVDTLGAGDVFHGAFALALAEGLALASAMRFAAAAAAIKCGRFGGGSGAPDRAEVRRFLESHAEN